MSQSDIIGVSLIVFILSLLFWGTESMKKMIRESRGE